MVASLKVATMTACGRIARWAFAYASRRGRREVAVFHKANIMKLTDGLFIRCAKEVHESEFPQIAYRELIIDAGCMRLVQDPARFDVLLDDGAIFEAVHGSAPDIAGQGIANPLALLMSGVMMLDHLVDTQSDVACSQVAQRIREAYNRALADGKKTRDLGGDLSTDAFAQAVIERLPA